MAIERFDSKICGFCGKGESEVSILITGPKVNVCDECISLLSEMAEEKKKEPNPFKSL